MDKSPAIKGSLRVRVTSHNCHKELVDGYCIGDWGIFKSDINWRVVHIPSGLYTYGFGYPRKKNAFMCARELSSMFSGYDPSIIGNVPSELLGQSRRCIRYWSDKKTRAKGYTKQGILKAEGEHNG